MQSCPNGPVTAADILFDIAAILRTVGDPATAKATADLINGGGQTERQFLTQLVTQSFNTSMPSTTVYNSMYGIAMSTGKEFDILASFSANQLAFGTKLGVQDPTVYVYEALGQALANGSDTGATTFKDTFGPTAIANDATFVNVAYTKVFGAPPSTVQAQQFINQVAFFNKIYTANPPQGATDANAIDLLARGAVFGQMQGVAAQNPNTSGTTQTQLAQAASFLQDLATVDSFSTPNPPGDALGKFNVSLANQLQNSNPFTPGVTINLDNFTALPITISPNESDPAAKSTNGNDLFVSPSKANLQSGTIINGGQGLDVFKGLFTTGATPNFTNTEQLIFQGKGAADQTLHLGGSSGYQQVFVDGTVSGTTNVTIDQIKIGTNVGVQNFQDPLDAAIVFKYAGANGTQAVELDINGAGKFSADPDSIGAAGFADPDVTINNVSILNICSSGTGSGFNIGGDSLTTVNIRGLAAVAIDTDDLNATLTLTKIDASALNAAYSFDIDTEANPMTIIAGQKGGITEIAGVFADRLTFGDPTLTGVDTAQITDATELTGPFPSTGVLDAQAIWVSNFVHAQDSIDLSETNAFTTGPGGAKVYTLTTGQNTVALSKATLETAAEFALTSATNPNTHIAVFQYNVGGVNTYAVVDNNGNDVVDTGDGLIKLVGVSNITGSDFVGG